MEKTLSIIKPDAVKRGLTGEINSLIEKNKMKIIAQKMIHLSLDDAKGFYFIHKERAFFNDLCEYMTSGPIVVQVLMGRNVINNYRYSHIIIYFFVMLIQAFLSWFVIIGCYY